MYAHHIYPAWDPTGKWRISKSSNYYYNMHNVAKFDQDHSLRTRDYTVFDNPKKTYLEDTLGGLNIKSSQLEIARKHILNPLQLRRMLMFDLNDYKDVKKSNYKYDIYWWQGGGEDSGIGQVKECMNFHLNKYDQQYLLKNGLSLSDFLDYLKQCKRLGIKNKHPKFFNDEHAKLSEKCRKIEEMEHAEMMKHCKNIINSMVKVLPEYKNGDITISPVKSASELKKNAEYMQNCIYGYLDQYLERKCILYIVRKKRKIVANVELVKEFEEKSVIEGVKRGIDKKACEDIRKAILDNCAYLFNKSHSIAYSFISYWTAWVKGNYPLVFYVSLFNTESVDSLQECMKEAKRHGIIIAPPDISKSQYESTIEDIDNKVIRMGLKCVKGIGEKAVEDLVPNQPFASFQEFFLKNKGGKGGGKAVVEAGIDIGAFENISLIVSQDLIKDDIGTLKIKEIQ
jgi:DNA polymerase III alpha subunit